MKYDYIPNTESFRIGDYFIDQDGDLYRLCYADCNGMSVVLIHQRSACACKSISYLNPDLPAEKQITIRVWDDIATFDIRPIKELIKLTA